MPYFEWETRYGLGISSIDLQHKKIIDLINDLHQAINSHDGPQKVSTVLDEMLSYTNVHFSAEEALLQQHQYPGLMEHKDKHDGFALEAISFISQLRTGDKTVSERTLTFLRDWLVQHIMGVDKQYVAFLISKGAR